MKSSTKVALLVFFVLLIDQGLKLWVKTNMFYGEGINLFGQPWAQLHFVENPGMAFGYNLGGDVGKVALSLFRIFAVGFLIYFINQLIKSKAKFGLLSCFGLILAGAIGNILDSSFYGFFFDKGTTWNAEMNDWVHYTGKAVMNFEGYANFLQGCVVDMLYFPILEGNFPSWFPYWGGKSFLFFRPVFNVADMSITIGVISIILFHRNFFSKGLDDDKENTDGTSLETTIDSKEATALAASTGIEALPDDPTTSLDTRVGEELNQQTEQSPEEDIEPKV